MGIFCDATWSHPPGAAHRSTHTRDRCKNSCFLFNCSNLKADLARKPKECFKDWICDTGVRCEGYKPRCITSQILNENARPNNILYEYIAYLLLIRLIWTIMLFTGFPLFWTDKIP